LFVCLKIHSAEKNSPLKEAARMDDLMIHCIPINYSAGRDLSMMGKIVNADFFMI
jgi:hypothetical protein